ncbi:hypothetical protein F5876DRAFT_61953 [Lentinula aff. lateritia]|uniref:Uncharacterized protein n=1 Tax=Lentinula aff. lateritia TaxID=2804960 RepID=A0ACC1UEK3_9AGAR|nr:hypothetical protein F5876DRAFT_61953 [Lentinula aff. lateritia]
MPNILPPPPPPPHISKNAIARMENPSFAYSRCGDSIVSSANLFGGTFIQFKYENLESYDAAVDEHTKAIFVKTQYMHWVPSLQNLANVCCLNRAFEDTLKIDRQRTKKMAQLH